jgi:diguanylate cyclase (GGDEF)-like protein
VFRPAVQDGGSPGLLMPLAMEQDRTGFLWEAGDGGLARWDGYGFHLYTTDSARADGLADHSILTLHRDQRDRLWVGSVTGGLARYDPAADHFTQMTLDDGSGPARCVWQIADDADGGLWVATSTGLFHLDAAGHVLARVRGGDLADGTPGALPFDKIEAVLRDRHGAVWVGGPGGLARSLDGRYFAGVPLPVPDGTVAEVSHLVEDSAGQIWGGSREQGAYVIGAFRGPAKGIDATAPAPGEPAAAEIKTMVQASPTEVWLGTAGGGIVAVNIASLRTRRIRHDPFVPGSLPKNNVSSLFRDRSGLLWVGTVQGLSRYDAGGAGILTLLGDPERGSGSRIGLRASDASAVLARRDGSLWVGSEDNGVQILDASGGNAGALALPRVFGMAEIDGAGRDTGQDGGHIYIGTNSGLFVADAAGTAAVRIDVPWRAPNAVVNTLAALGGSLWLGGGQDGVWELRAGAGSMRVLRRITAPALTNNTVYAITSAPDGRIAVGTDLGFNLLDPARGTVERILPDPARPGSLKPGAALCFATDRHRRLWVGTSGSGIAVMVGRDAAGRPRFQSMGRAEGLPDLDISALLVDAQGMIWASTDRGLAEIDPDNFTARALQTPQGVVVTSYWSGSGAITPQGDLVFGGAGGLTIVQPSLVSHWHYRPPVVVTGIRVGGVMLPSGMAAGLQGGGTLDILPDANSLSVEFASLDFSAPELNRYSYRLEGFDRDWTWTDAAHRMAAYTNLPPGLYTLRLRGSNRDGVWSEPALLRLRVLPAWYQTDWFRFCEASVGLLGVGIVVRWRTMILRRRQRELERQVAERTAELRASQRDLETLAYLDPLTSLPNRRAFNEHLHILTAAAPAAPFSLVLVDLDGFKTVNDQFGHQTGDALLGLAADRLRHAVRTCDFVARLGGDEFAVLVHDVRDPEQVDSLCERIVDGMAKPLALDGKSITIGASVGATLYPWHGPTPDELYRHVDLALYEAKHTGRGTWCWFEATPPCHPPSRCCCNSTHGSMAGSNRKFANLPTREVPFWNKEPKPLMPLRAATCAGIHHLFERRGARKRRPHATQAARRQTRPRRYAHARTGCNRRENPASSVAGWQAQACVNRTARSARRPRRRRQPIPTAATRSAVYRTARGSAWTGFSTMRARAHQSPEPDLSTAMPNVPALAAG